MRLSDFIRRDKAILTETDRVVALDQVWDYPDAEAWADARWGLPGSGWTFRSVQAQALYVMARCRGLLAPIGVGHGKTLVSWLAPDALGVDRAVIMMPPRDVVPYNREVVKYQSGFRYEQGAGVQVVPYSILSATNSSALLDEYKPQAIICDEAHCLADPDSVRTRRFLRYMEEHPETLFVAMSGTLYKKSITDVAHLSRLALRELSPMPRGGEDLALWARILDVRGCAEAHEYAWFESSVTKYMHVSEEIPGKIARARKAAYIRLASSPGVVTTETASCDAQLTIRRVDLPVPEHLRLLIQQVKASREAPDGEDIYATEAHHVTAMRNIASGFYYKWDWNAIGGRNDDWLMRRTAWLRELTNELARHSKVNYDSPALVANKIDQELGKNPGLADQFMLYFARAKWNEVAHLPEPPRVTVWLDKYLIDFAMLRYPDDPVIFWYDSIAIEEELRARGLTCYGRASYLTGPERRLAASVNAHGQGRNLQDWSHAVVLEPSMGGSVWEQLLGRLHRGGQTRTVTYDLLVAGELFEASLNNARKDARFIEDMSGSPQRLLSSVWEDA